MLGRRNDGILALSNTLAHLVTSVLFATSHALDSNLRGKAFLNYTSGPCQSA